MTHFSIMMLLPMTVGLPLLAAIVSVIINSHRWRTSISTMFATIQTLIVILLLLAIPDADGLYRYTLGGWGAPLGIDLVVDGLSLILLLTTTVLVLVLNLYSIWYFSDVATSTRFWPLWWLLVAGLNAAFIAADAFNIYVALEMIGLAAVALVALTGTRTALVAALRYALVGLLGSLCYLLGVVLLYRAYGTLDLAQLATQTQASPLTGSALCLISVGLVLKTALFPLHFWLPPAHANAPAPVSAALSALVVKASFYLLMRFWLDVLNPTVTGITANFLGVLGAAAILWGSFAAFRTQRLKLLIAYSTVAQLGYLFMLFPLALTGSSPTPLSNAAVTAVTYFIIAHALAKAAMFLAAGNILASCGHDKIDKLQGLVCYQPLALLTFALAGVSLIGLPPSGGFIAKWLLLNAAIENGQWWWVVVMLGGGLLAAAYIGRVINIAFSQASTEKSTGPMKTVPERHSLQVNLAMPGLALAMLAILLGFNAQWILNLLEGSIELHLANAGGVQ